MDLLEETNYAVIEMPPGTGKTLTAGMVNATLAKTHAKDMKSLTIVLPASSHLAHEQQFELGVHLIGFTPSHNKVALLKAGYKTLNHVTRLRLRIRVPLANPWPCVASCTDMHIMTHWKHSNTDATPTGWHSEHCMHTTRTVALATIGRSDD